MTCGSTLPFPFLSSRHSQFSREEVALPCSLPPTIPHLFFVGRPCHCATSTLSVSCDKITGEEGDEQEEEEEEEEEATAWVLQCLNGVFKSPSLMLGMRSPHTLHHHIMARSVQITGLALANQQQLDVIRYVCTH